MSAFLAVDLHWKIEEICPYISVGEYDKERFNKNLKKYTFKMYEVIKFLEVII